MDLQNVFEAHPNADKIFVVGDMPFVNERHADNHAKDTGKEKQVVMRLETAWVDDLPLGVAALPDGPDDVPDVSSPDESLEAEAEVEAKTEAEAELEAEAEAEAELEGAATKNKRTKKS